MSVSGSRCSFRACFYVFAATMLAVVLLGCLSWLVILVKSPMSVPVYEGDVVYVKTINGFFYDHVVVSSNLADEKARLVFSVFYADHSPTEEILSNESFSSKEFSYPQSVLVNDSKQVYLLEGSLTLSSRIHQIFQVQQKSVSFLVLRTMNTSLIAKQIKL